MARQLKETANATVENVDASMAETAKTVLAEVMSERLPFLKRKWEPFTTKEALPPATYKVKERVRILANGVAHTVKETTCESVGEPRFKVTSGNELIKVYKKRGGTGTRLVYQFKQQYADTPEGKQRRKFDAAFRKHLRACGVPGA